MIMKTNQLLMGFHQDQSDCEFFEKNIPIKFCENGDEEATAIFCHWISVIFRLYFRSKILF